MSGNITPTIQYQADNRKYFTTNSSNLFLTTTLSKSNLNSVFTNLTINDGIIMDLDTWIGSLGNNKTTLYNAISGLNWGIGSPLTHNGNNASFGINNNVSLGSRYTIANYISSATFGSQTNLKLFYKSPTEVGVFNGILANIGVASYGTDQTKHSVNNLRQPENTTLWGTLQNGYLYYDASNGKAIYFDNAGIGFLNSNLLTKYSGRWLPFLDAGNYYGQGVNRLVFGDNSWNSTTNNTIKGSINHINIFHSDNGRGTIYTFGRVNSNIHHSNDLIISPSPWKDCSTNGYSFLIFRIASDYDLGFQIRTDTFYSYSRCGNILSNNPLIYSFFPLY